MSFGAVLGLLLLGPVLGKVSEHAVWKGFTATTCAQLGALPSISHCYGHVSLLSLLTNLAAAPLAGLLIPLAVLALLASVISLPLGRLLALPAQGMTWLILMLGRIAEEITASQLRIAAFAPWTTAFWYGGMCIVSSGFAWKTWKRAAALGIAAILACTAGVLMYRGEDRYVQLDVGQALSSVLEVDGNCFVYDCGRQNSALAEYLAYRGDEVDALFLSHPHSDHIGGLLEVLEDGIEIHRVYVPILAQVHEESWLYQRCLDELAARDIPVVELRAGDEVQIDSTVFEVLAPGENTDWEMDSNDRSLVLRTVVNGSVLLLCGDSDGVHEPAVDCDVLQVPHHGSANAADWEAVSVMTPRVALISAGENNSYGHPNENTVKRLENSGAQIYQTSQSGAVMVYFQKDGLWVEEYIR